MPKWYTSQVVSYTRNEETIFLPLIASRVNKEEIYTNENGVQETHYYEERAYNGKGLSVAYSTENVDIGTVALVRIEDHYQSGIDSNGNPVYTENPIPDIKYATAVTDFNALTEQYPLLKNKFIDQPGE